MRKIRIIEHISLDGVIQAPGGPGEDRDGDFQAGAWSMPFADPAVGKHTAVIGQVDTMMAFIGPFLAGEHPKGWFE
jgi:hypothetical protein